MNIEAIIKEDRRQINPDKIEMPENIDGQQSANAGNQVASDGKQQENVVQMSLKDMANMCIMGYNIISTAVYKHFEKDFNASLTAEEFQALQAPTEAVLEQYNITLTPVVCLCLTLGTINITKITQLKFYRAEKAKAEKAKEQAEKDKKGVQNTTTETPGASEKAKEQKKVKK